MPYYLTPKQDDFNQELQICIAEALYDVDSIVTCWPATIEAKCLREANPYACFRSGASIPAKRILCCLWLASRT